MERFYKYSVVILPVIAGLFSLVPPLSIGTSSGALAVQSLEHWMYGHPDTFEALHVHWLWIPRLFAIATQTAIGALLVFRAVLAAVSVLLVIQTARRLFDERRAAIAGAMMAANATVLYVSHTFSLPLLTLTAATLLLYLFTSPEAKHHKIGALLLGLSLSIGFWPFVLLISVLTVGLNLHHTVYTLRSKSTFALFGLILVGVASYLLLEIFYFGGAHVWNAMNPAFYPPHGVSLIAQGLIVAAVSANLLLILPVRRKRGGLGREFSSAFLILGVYVITNLFSREEMLHDAAILVPCLILVAMDSLPKWERFGMIYIAFNLLLFFLLPAIPLDPQIALSDRSRTERNDPIAFSYYGAFDLFSDQALLAQRSGESQARAIILQEQIDSTLVLLNGGTDEWFDGATLGALFPQGHFGWFYGVPINRVRINGLLDTAFARPLPERPYLAGLFEKSFARTFIDSALPPGVPLKESADLQYIDCRGNAEARKALIDRLLSLEYQGFHHR